LLSLACLSRDYQTTGARARQGNRPLPSLDHTDDNGQPTKSIIRILYYLNSKYHNNNVRTKLNELM